MTWTWHSARLLALCVAIGHVAASAAQPTAAAEPPILLGTGGADYSAAAAINNRRQVVGRMQVGTEGLSRPFLWEDGVMRELERLGPTGYGHASDINDRGQIVGVSVDADGFGQATLWQDGQVTALARLPQSYACAPTAINGRGLIAGNCFIAGDVYTDFVAVVWRDGVPVRMLPPGTQAFPRDINDAGVVVGTAYTAAGDPFEFVWRDGVMTDVTTLAGRRFDWVSGINRRGEITGWASGGISIEALFWDGRTTVVLPGLGGTGGTTPNGLNDRGDVVGRSGPRPVLWKNGAPIELPAASVGYVSIPVAINDRGDVVGNAVIGPYEFVSVAALWPGAAKHGPR